ncbi:hypothetical protein O4H61_07820 [Roseovarius aestuarii]|nr:hypothetical protein [Roseovarius aestuarii]
MTSVNTILRLALLGGALMALPAKAQSPLSAIDWLNDPVPVAAPRVPLPQEPPVSKGVSIPDVTVMTLDAATQEAVGLLPAAVTGLPASLWSQSDVDTLLALWSRASSEPLPAVQALYYTLLLAEADPPKGADGAYLKARVEALMQYGAVEPAQALLSRAGPTTTDLFPLWFDLALLSGDETLVCPVLHERPALHPSYGAQIYCTALTGDWRTAALLYDTAVALKVLAHAEEHLLGLFLDPEAAETSPELAPVANPSPLVFRLYEAIGTPLSTRSLPLAYAISDLRSTSGWRTEIEAAERLVRTGALSENRLLGLYTDRRPAASGGIWDRVEAIQKFDRALSVQDANAVADTLPVAWRYIRAAQLEIPFATLFGEDLYDIPLTGAARDLALRIALLGANYESAAAHAGPERDVQFLASVARGAPDPALAVSAREKAIAEVFATAPVATPDYARLIKNGKLGEAILMAAQQLDRAVVDVGHLGEALTILRAVGLEDTARRGALQLLILDRSG